jgi:hypothetical protein
MGYYHGDEMITVCRKRSCEPRGTAARFGSPDLSSPATHAAYRGSLWLLLAAAEALVLVRVGPYHFLSNVWAVSL